MSIAIHLSSVRKNLAPRREPYWAAPIARGKFVGFRKINGDDGRWIARMRDESGRQVYRSLGCVSDAFDFDRAKEEARRWFQLRDAGVMDAVLTVAEACREYVEDRRREKGEATAHDAEMRFRRTVYEHSIGRIQLAKLRTPHIKAWRHGLQLAPASSNRNLAVLKAALNLAVRNRQASRELEREWRDVAPLKVVGRRRTLFLDLTQRRALIASCSGAIRDLIQGAALTGARPGELTAALRHQFDARTASMTFIGKTGGRTVPLSPAALRFFKRLVRSKLPNANLFVRDDGKPWAHSDWDELVKEAAARADLPATTCLYTLRHSFITTAIIEGLSTLDVARLVGTSVQMIEQHYGHLVHSAARERLAKLKII
jgi:integrase